VNGWLTVIDMLDLLRELVPQLSSQDREKLFKLVLKLDVLIVMANHSAVEVRVAVIQVSCYFRNMNE